MATAAVVLVLAGSLSACTDDDPAAGEVDGEIGGGAQAAVEVLETVEWGVLDGMVSVVVRNDTDRTLRHAQAVVTAVDQRGTTLATSTAQGRRSDCCTVFDLPPDASYGLYFDIETDPADIADVTVRFRDVSWGPADLTADPGAQAAPVEIRGGTEGAVVVADVAPTVDALDGATVQAMLESEGRFLAVVSGRWRCFAAGTTTRIRMQLFHPVPPGTSVSAVTVLPIRAPNESEQYDDAGAPGNGTCAGVS